jgi:hypothetical protein
MNVFAHPSGPVSPVDDAGRMASELVASAIRHTDARSS